MRVVCQQTIFMKYHALFIIFEIAENFEFVVSCKLYVVLYGLTHAQCWSIKRSSCDTGQSVHLTFNLLLTPDLEVGSQKGSFCTLSH